MTLKQRYDAILGYFRDNVPIAESELHFDSPYQLLVAVILSAQCTDKRVNMTTPALFSAYPTPEALAEAIVELYRSDMQGMKQKARAYAEKFSWNDCFKRQLELYRQICNKN